MINEIFTTNKYDEKIAIINENKEYSYGDLKKIIAKETEFIKNKKNNVVISNSDNFSFIIQFFASIFCKKNIYLVADKYRLKEFNSEFDILDGISFETQENYKFEEIKDVTINFYTSGSSGNPKIIKKTLYNLEREAEDLTETFKFKNLSVISTTTMCHLFGLTFHLMMPLYSGLKINTQKISYPENIEYEDCILISTPAFLSSVEKFNVPFKTNPKYIISAGSKLNKSTLEYLESNIIEIYGSTETGIIGYKTDYDKDFELFKNVEVKAYKNNVQVYSDYIYENNVKINDKIEINNRKLHILNRTDRLYKIHEKRVSADELENKLKTNLFVKDCYIIKIDNKLVCLCALSEQGQEYLLANGIFKLTTGLKKYISKFSEIIPQKWKYIDRIPLNIMGKVDKKLIEHIFNVNFSLPVILKREFSKNCVVYKILFYDKCNFFEGHFNKFKIVPGVVQLFIAKEFANIHFNLKLGVGQYKRIKFANIIEPNTIVNLKLENRDGKVTYEYFSEDKKYSSGIFLCDNIFMSLYHSEYKLKVSFEDLDPMNIVWHGNYIRYMEQARCDMFSKLNYTYIDMKEDGYAYPIAKLRTKYIKPAMFGDILTVKLDVIAIEPALNIKYLIYKDSEKIFEAETMQIGLDINTGESLYNPPKKLVDAMGYKNEKI